MLVQDIMTQQVVAIDPDMPIGDVYALMQQRDIRHFPIVEDTSAGASTLVGIVSDRDIRLVGSALPQAPEGVKLADPVRKLMSSPVITTHPSDAVEESASLLRRKKIGAMPVLDEGELVGIVSAIDFLEALVRMTGVHRAASRLEVELTSDPSALAELSAAVASQGITILSVLSSQDDPASGTLVVSLRVTTIDIGKLARHLRSQSFNVIWPPEPPQTVGHTLASNAEHA
ncbi:MAG: CBS and ACT domain-containing protein [Deinococcota bacterium]